ncbi:MAG TPA: hypothetical protein VK335_15090 [Bryobacteraceae bacterium]|nr:hypothetical protein [Bryobacteraceae bacterium]
MNTNCLAQLAGVTKRFGKTVALDGLDMEVRRGERFARPGSSANRLLKCKHDGKSV